MVKTLRSVVVTKQVRVPPCNAVRPLRKTQFHAARQERLGGNGLASITESVGV
jgi:hypothetical protein